MKGRLEVETEGCASLPRAFASCVLPTEMIQAAPSHSLPNYRGFYFYYFYLERELESFTQLRGGSLVIPLTGTPHYCRIRMRRHDGRSRAPR